MTENIKSFEHYSVMLGECLEGLDIKQTGIYVDGTAGGAGHSAEIAKRLNGGTLYAFDQDPDAIETARQRLAGLPAVVVESNFRFAGQRLAKYGVEKIDGALLDLGVSSHQLDTAERGFSYREDAPLDMRMSQTGETVAELIARLDRQQLTDILRKYGEEPYAWQIAGKIEAAQQQEPILTTGRLAEIVVSAVPPAVRRKDKNPARRTFQALRIAVNEELDALDEGLDELFNLLNTGGRLAVLTFHSLEDRIVKQRFKALATACTCPPDLPVCICGGVAKGRLVNRKPITATPEELEQNRRSRSAKLRIIEKL